MHIQKPSSYQTFQKQRLSHNKENATFPQDILQYSVTLYATSWKVMGKGLFTVWNE